MHSKLFAIVIAAAVFSTCVALAATPAAEASPRFTVINKSDSKAKIDIFSGGDSYCKVPEKAKTVSVGETDTFGCTGNGKGRCKVSVNVSGEDACSDIGDTCGDWKVKIEGGSTLTITGKDDRYDCQLN